MQLKLQIKVCARGDPEINWPEGPSLSTLLKGTPRSCTVNSNCLDTTHFSCQKIGTASYCCAKPDYICSVNGGLDYIHGFTTIPSATQIYDPGLPGGSSRTFARLEIYF